MHNRPHTTSKAFAVVRVEVTCSDPAVAFAGEWPREESASAVLDHYRARAKTLGIPIQVAIERVGIWTIAPNGKAIAGALFDAEKTQTRGKARKRSVAGAK